MSVFYSEIDLAKSHCNRNSDVQNCARSVVFLLIFGENFASKYKVASPFQALHVKVRSQLELTAEVSIFPQLLGETPLLSF